MNRCYPGSTLGILGGGQLGWMIALAAQRMGYRTAVMDPAPNAAAQRVADVFVPGAFDDVAAAKQLAEKSDVITLETEHIPYAVLRQLEGAKIRPRAEIFDIVQSRVTQRAFLRKHGFPQAEHVAIQAADDLVRAETLGFPAILKSSTGGYDGKGQARVKDAEALQQTWQQWGKPACVLERVVPFEMEISVILARDIAGQICVYPLAENVHREHILFLTVAPARVSSAVAQRATEVAVGIAQAMDYVGVMAVEMFVVEGDVLVNEIAPRVHNSGHYTFGACVTSQFEQHVRAVCGLPLGQATLYRPAVMLNLLGDVWHAQQPRWDDIFVADHAKLFLYGKEPSSPKRKMGHVLLSGEDQAALIAQATQMDQRLRGVGN
jgi:5-(carboxyamino)imidazole ribonucleotide synthase